ncbi:MAG TPA: NO-inducible flavohemoprotein [Candidatus Limnocylindria bacterium]|nr:NO-inducible flavohemoprotein [Candidatus Limnocylindria bacterium]
MLAPRHLQIVQATVPVLQTHGEAISAWFYRDLFDAHPELFNVFNPVNQRDGSQARSLAAAILSYAAAIDQPERLAAMVERIANKHGSLEVLPEHYPIVGEHLLRAIRSVLGDAASDDVLEAWGAAYGVLAEIMIGREAELYAGRWRGFKPFRVARRVEESETIASFHLVPEDGELVAHRPGQYVSVNVHVPGAPYAQIRQYSLSCAPNGREYRISVKREAAPAGVPVAGGLVSNYLHEHVRTGDTLLVHAPLGDFVLDEESSRPIVLLSGGAGITPVMGMLEQLAATRSSRAIVFVHAATQRSHHAFRDAVREIVSGLERARAVVFYERVSAEERRGEDYDETGLIDAARLRGYLPAEADIYTSGPPAFVDAMAGILDTLGVPRARRHDESFAPDPEAITASAA